MTADVLLADFIVFTLERGAWLLLLLPVYVAGHLFGRWSQRREDRTRLAVAEFTAAADRERATKALAYGAALADDVVAMQVQLQRVGDVLALVELEKGTEWEEQR
jgi:hypothetical protein